MGSIIWIASYPKSGNTWLRALLANYFSSVKQPASINELGAQSIAVSRYHFDETIGIASSDLTHDEIDYYRPQFCREIADINDAPFFVKVHDAYRCNHAGESIFPADATAGIVYLVRNPLDIVASYAHHSDKSMDEIIDLMAHNGHGFGLNANTIEATLPVTLDSWSNHVSSWLSVKESRLYVVRYEDLLSDTMKVFFGVLEFSGVSVDRNKLEKAVNLSKISELQAQEKQYGFSEKQPTAKSFFRKGGSGKWRNELNDRQIKRVIEDHRHMIEQLSYLPDFGCYE